MFNLKDTLTRIVESGYSEEDSTETRQKKAALTLVPIIIGPAAFIWGAIYFYLDHPLSGSIPMSYSAISLLTLIHFFKNKNTAFLEISQLLLVLLLPFFLMWSLGGFFYGSTVMIWALFTPIAASIFMHKKYALLWFIAYFALLLISATLQHFLSTNITPINETARIIFFILNLGAGSAGLYLLVSYTSNQEKLAISKINHKQRQLEMKTEGLRMSNARLAEARANAEAANIAKSDFLANMSHEIRTPMHAIMGMTNLALQTDLNDRQKNYLNKTLYSAENLLRIINDILDFSKIEAKKLTLETVDFQLDELIENMISMIKIKAQDKNIELSLHIDSNVPSNLIGDPLRLSQVMINLLDNAIKFSKQGDKVLFNTTVIEESELDVQLQFHIQDTGIGISSEQREKLFQPFNQADNSTTRKYGGTGLGLVISKNIIQMMDGDIFIESELGVGTSFTFTVNLKKQENIIPEITTPASHNQNSLEDNITKLKGCKILVVDDNDLNHEYIHELLDMAGMTVETAFNGQKALEILTEQRFDCVLMDCQMPVMDGYQATQQIRKTEKIKDTPVIAMTANAMKGDREKALTSGMNDYISKPFRIDDMYATLAKWIQKN